MARTYQGEDGVNMMSPALLMMNNGDVGLFYLVRPGKTETNEKSLTKRKSVRDST